MSEKERGCCASPCYWSQCIELFAFSCKSLTSEEQKSPYVHKLTDHD